LSSSLAKRPFSSRSRPWDCLFISLYSSLDSEPRPREAPALAFFSGFADLVFEVDLFAVDALAAERRLAGFFMGSIFRVWAAEASPASRRVR
jgi:hypothetical protein